MTFFLIALIVLAVFIIIVYNQIVGKRELMHEAWSGIDVQLKRRHDLIPNLVNVVQGYVTHEKETLMKVTEMRSQATGATAIKDRAVSEGQLTQALKSLFAVTEAYPNLKADALFINLQNSLVEIEDELQLSRRYYNGTARDLNIMIQSFPNNILAGMFKFQPVDFFELDSDLERSTPSVKI